LLQKIGEQTTLYPEGCPVNKAALHGDGHRVCAAPRVELGQDRPDVRLDRFFLYAELRRDLRVATPVGYLLQDIELS
jgi:hypothetical protein